ncbi:hypothetical protein Tco_1517859 [Tanacetum coccineum]
MVADYSTIKTLWLSLMDKRNNNMSMETWLLEFKHMQRDTLNKTMSAKSYEEKVPAHLMKYADERDSA